MKSNYSGKIIIGRDVDVDIPAEGVVSVPAKVDTGADGSAIWASEIVIDDMGELSFCLFARQSKLYSGRRHKTKSFDVVTIRSSHGTLQIRYRVKLLVVIAGKKVRGTFTLADRSKNTYPILIGCRLLNKKFLVDVSKGYYRKSGKSSKDLNTELQKNPQKFFNKYHADNQRGDLEL